MKDELTARQQAIRMRLAGESVPMICKVLKRAESWVHKWWQRYGSVGADGLHDLTRAHDPLVNRTPPHIERAIRSIRRRLAAHTTAHTRYACMGAATIRTELEALGYSPMPTLRTIERIVQRANLSNPPLRLARRVPQTSYPDPPAHDVNQVHQVHIVGPRYLTGDKTKYYFLICKDAFDQAVYAEFHAGCSMDQVWPFLIHAWQQVGLPQDVQFDNGKSFYGWGRWSRSLNRVIRLALRLGVHPVFIPAARPQRNGSVENFNGWFQPALLSQPFPNAVAVRRALRQLLMTANEQHVHQHLGYKTAAQFRHGKRLRKLPANCALNLAQIPVAIGQITFIRWLSLHRRVDSLGESVSGGRCPRYQSVKLVLDTRRQHRKVYHNGRLIKQPSFQLRIS